MATDKIPVLHIDLDKKCSRCGAKGAAPNGFCLSCITKKITGGGISMAGVTINFQAIEELKVRTAKDGKVVIQFEAMLNPGDIARLLNVGKYGAMNAVFVSPQAAFDLRFETIDAHTSEVKD